MKRYAAAAAAFTSHSTFAQFGFNHSYFHALSFAINQVQLRRDVEKYDGGATEVGSVLVGCSTTCIPAGGRGVLFLVTQRSAGFL